LYYTLQKENDTIDISFFFLVSDNPKDYHHQKLRGDGANHLYGVFDPQLFKLRIEKLI